MQAQYHLKLDSQGYITPTGINEFPLQEFVDRFALDEVSYKNSFASHVYAQTDFSAGFDYKKLTANNIFKDSSNIDIHKKTGEFRLSKKFGDAIVLSVTTINGTINSSVASIVLTDSTNLPTASTIRIGSEEISYTGNAANTLTGCTRGVNGTTAAAHTTGAATEEAKPVVFFKQYDNKLFLACNQNVWVSTDGASWSVSKNCGNTITDGEVAFGKLYVAMGTNGLWEYDGSSWTQPGSCSTEDATYLCSWQPATTERLFAVFVNKFKYTEDGSTWEDIKTYSTDEDMYLTKPIVVNYRMFFFTVQGNTDYGKSKLQAYDSFNVVDGGFETEYPVGMKQYVYKNAMYFLVQEYDGSTIYAMQADGTIGGIKKFEHTAGDFMYGVYQYNVKEYGEGNVIYSDPIEWGIYEDRLLFTMQSTALANYVFAYDGIGFSKYVDMDSKSSNYGSFGVFQKRFYKGSAFGVVKKMQQTYSSIGWLETSELDMGLMDIDKLYLQISVLHDKLPQNTSVALYYKLNNVGAWVQVGDTNITADTTASIGQFSEGSYAKKISLKITLTTSSDTLSPVVEDLILRYTLAPYLKKRYDFSVLCIDGLILLDGSNETKTGEELYSALKNSERKKAALEFQPFNYKSTILGSPLSLSDITIQVNNTAGFPTAG